MENFQFLAKKNWYKQWWGVTILVVSCLFVSLGIAISLLTWRYYGLIKQGHGDDLRKIIFGNQQSDLQITITREELEKKNRPFLGNSEAELVIVEFIDFKCPVCKQQDAIIRQIVSKYGQKIKLIIRNFPIESLYPGTSKFSEMAYCAHEQGLYWGAHDYLFSRQEELVQNLTAENINSFINYIGADKIQFNACLVSSKTKTEVNLDYATGYKYGVMGTPTFFINGYKTQGSIPLNNWEEMISSILTP